MRAARRTSRTAIGSQISRLTQAAAAPDDGEVRAVEQEVVVPFEAGPGAVEHLAGHGQVPTADLAHEVAELVDGGALVDRRAVGEVDVADGADLLEQGQRAVDGGDVHVGDGGGQLVGRERAGLVPDGVDDGGAGAPDAVALGPQAGHDLVQLDELARVDLTDLRHGADPTPPRRVADLPQHQAVGRGDLAGGVAVPGDEDAADVAGRDPPDADVDERADDRAHHLVAERRGPDLEAQVVGIVELASSGPRAPGGPARPRPPRRRARCAAAGGGRTRRSRAGRSGGRRPPASPSATAVGARTRPARRAAGSGRTEFQTS